MNKILFLCVFCYFSFSLMAQEEGFVEVSNKPDVEHKLIEASSTTTSIVSDFKQEKQLEYLSTTIESSGKFWFKDGNKLRWEYTSPFNYLIVINNGVFTIKDEDKTNVFDTKSNKAFQELNEILISTVNGTLINSGKFDIEIYENNDAYLVKLAPKNIEMKEILKSIDLYFSKVDLAVFKVKMTETKEDYTIITFTNKELNSDINNQLFEIK